MEIKKGRCGGELDEVEKTYFKLFVNCKSSILLKCQAELVEADVLKLTRLRQDQPDS